MMFSSIASSALPFAHQASTAKTGSTSSTDSTDSTSDTLANSSSDLFLQLLVAQLKTQDPTSPMDPTQMVGQMLSMNQLNELIQIRQLMQGTTPQQPRRRHNRRRHPQEPNTMPNFSIPLSGLTAASQALSVISNNLANLNTVGFKESSASFSDLFYQAFGTNGANDPIQVGEGVALGSVTPNFTGGNLEGTGVPTDAAITGNGLFVTQKNGVDGITPGRATSLSISQGQLTTQDGAEVMGYPAVNGVDQPVPDAWRPLVINQGPAHSGNPTTAMPDQTNLDASSAVGTIFPRPLPCSIRWDSHVLTYNSPRPHPTRGVITITLPAADTGGAGAPTVINNRQRDVQSGWHSGHSRRPGNRHRDYRSGRWRRQHEHDLEPSGLGGQFPAHTIRSAKCNREYLSERLRRRNPVRLQHYV